MTDRHLLSAGDKVLLIDGRDRRYMITLATGKQWHSHMGTLDHDALIGQPEGIRLTTSNGGKVLAFRPTLADFVKKMRRGAQVVYPKDIGLILVYADIREGARVLEAGTGSGSLTLALARAVGDSGQVISYELRDDHHEQALENISAWYSGTSKPENLELRVGDVFDGVPETDFDRVVLDLPEPWRGVGTTTE